MRRFASVLSAVVACSGAPEPHDEERVDTIAQPFESAEAKLHDFEFDGRLFAGTNEPVALATLVRAQLMYAIGQLNGDRSVGWYERLELSAITAQPLAATNRYDVRYHARLPVAWGASSVPEGYTFTLPAAVSAEDQTRFTQKYGTTCVDPYGGDLNAGERPDAGRMFLFYRPEREGCILAPEDVVKAYEDFLGKASSLLGAAPVERLTMDDRRRARIRATLDDGRTVRVEATLIGPGVEDESAAFDAWYEAASPNADVILYSGHAAHGANVRELMKKGSFRPAKYVIFVVNGCDTLAYVDRTLADRRAALNPDDPSGTKYMDTVSNVLGPWFRNGDETAMSLLESIVVATGPRAAPRTYRQILSRIDRDQIAVVTGEEDNKFPIVEPTVVRTPADEPGAAEEKVADDPSRESNARSEGMTGGGCAVQSGPAAAGELIFLVVAALPGARRLRRRAVGA